MKRITDFFNDVYQYKKGMQYAYTDGNKTIYTNNANSDTVAKVFETFKGKNSIKQFIKKDVRIVKRVLATGNKRVVKLKWFIPKD